MGGPIVHMYISGEYISMDIRSKEARNLAQTRWWPRVGSRVALRDCHVLVAMWDTKFKVASIFAWTAK